MGKKYRDQEYNHENSQEGYKFVVSNGAVTAVAEVEHGFVKNKSIKPKETYSISGNDILKTEREGAYQEVSRYTDANGDGLYLKVSEIKVLNTAGASTGTSLQNTLSRGDSDDWIGQIGSFRATEDHGARADSGTNSQEGYKFVVSDGAVTAVAEVEHGFVENKSIKPNETYSISGSDILKTEREGAYQEISRYTDANNDGLYLKIYETSVVNSVVNTGAAATTPLPQNFPWHDDRYGLGSHIEASYREEHAGGDDLSAYAEHGDDAAVAMVGLAFVPEYRDDWS